MLANREPYIHIRREAQRVHHPPAAWSPRSSPSCAHAPARGSRTAAVLRIGKPRTQGGTRTTGRGVYLLRRVWLSEEEDLGYYYGFSNEGLWPYVMSRMPARFSRAMGVLPAGERKFAEAALQEVDSKDPIDLVQDYHFALVAAHDPRKVTCARIIMFWHIPWPNSQRLGICPWPDEMLHGMLGSSILGFHTQFDCNNFVDSVDRYLEARIDRETTRSYRSKAHAGAAVSHLDPMARPVGSVHGERRRMRKVFSPISGCATTHRLARRRSPRLHKGHRRTMLAVERLSKPIQSIEAPHLRSAGSAEPDDHPECQASANAWRPSPTRQRALRRRTTGPSSSYAATTSPPRCFGLQGRRPVLCQQPS